MVDGEIVGSDEERLELRWIDALRAPGAPGGYRTVVDVVEERRSGRLTVVNGSGRDSDDSVRRGAYVLQQQDAREDGVFAPRDGRTSFRGMVEEEMRMRGGYNRAKMMYTPVRRKPVPVRMSGGGDEESPLALRGRRVDPGARRVDDTRARDEVDEEVHPINYRWRRARMGRPPIPSFESRGVTKRVYLG